MGTINIKTILATVASFTFAAAAMAAPQAGFDPTETMIQQVNEAIKAAPAFANAELMAKVASVKFGLPFPAEDEAILASVKVVSENDSILLSSDGVQALILFAVTNIRINSSRDVVQAEAKRLSVILAELIAADFSKDIAINDHAEDLRIHLLGLAQSQKQVYGQELYLILLQALGGPEKSA